MRNISKKTFNKYKDKTEKNQRDTRINTIIIVGIIILMIVGIVSLVILTKKTKDRLRNSNKVLPEYAEQLNQKKFEHTVEHVRDKGEMARMKVYLGDIFDNIEKENYEEIYARLDDEYKEKFFPKLLVLVDYLEGEFPKGAGYVIKNFERTGSLYVFVVDIVSVKDSKKKLDMHFVFEEEGFNDYRFSFSKK